MSRENSLETQIPSVYSLIYLPNNAAYCSNKSKNLRIITSVFSGFIYYYYLFIIIIIQVFIQDKYFSFLLLLATSPNSRASFSDPLT